MVQVGSGHRSKVREASYSERDDMPFHCTSEALINSNQAKLIFDSKEKKLLRYMATVVPAD